MVISRKIGRGLNRIVEEIGDCAGYVYGRGWAEASGGNISVDVTEIVPGGKGKSDRLLLITRSGCRFRETARRPWNDVLLVRHTVSDQMKVEYAPDKNARPTSELPTHLLIHDFFRAQGMTGKAVLHVHPDHIIALTHIRNYRRVDPLNRLLASMCPEIKNFVPEGVGFVPYLTPGSQNIAQATVKAIKKHRIVIWEKHGCVAVADALDNALDLIMTVEKAARIFFIGRGLPGFS